MSAWHEDRCRRASGPYCQRSQNENPAPGKLAECRQAVSRSPDTMPGRNVRLGGCVLKHGMRHSVTCRCGSGLQLDLRLEIVCFFACFASCS